MKRIFICVVALIAGSTGVYVGAHHAAQAQFDVERLETFKGELTKIEMINPHPQLYFTVQSGEEATAWRVEAPGIAALRRIGILRTLRVGQTYEIEYFPSRDGSAIALMGALTDSEGRRYGANLGGRPL